ncbi:hypothetical protein BZL30_3516 [Mycobacterium kansasii]|uniref:Uncharacterized protein n=1 Tax=Mycobacterium kansasii TaxID=1768 RepID=A0A1V3X904_MYCKA|nr:hypothetical protein BZL30_3516 [Mycobacterium kansasii]
MPRRRWNARRTRFLGAGPVMPAPGITRRRRPWRGMVLALTAIVLVAAVGTYLTAPRPAA